MFPFSRTFARTEVEAMVRKISGPNTDAETLEWARRIAEAQVDLNRVRTRRKRLLTRFLVDPEYQPPQVHRQRLRLMNTILILSALSA